VQINKVNTYHYNFLKFYSLESITYISKTIGIKIALILVKETTNV
jgi:hypothetical protein